MIFEHFLPKQSDPTAVALSDGLKELTYADLAQISAALPFSPRGGLVVLATENSLQSVAGYVACVEAHVPVLLLDKEIEGSFLEDVIERFRPQAVVGFNVENDSYQQQTDTLWGLIDVRIGIAAATNEELCVMLGTSGSTGNPKFVKLSRQNIFENAKSIAESLEITHTERAITSLPFSYTYGLSVINSHIVSGASVHVTPAPVVSFEFWEMVKSSNITSLAGVPTTYRMLKQMRWDPKLYPSLRYMTQAGGRLPDADRQYFLDLLEPLGIRFYVMYGQTEATARISVAPPSLLREHISTAGYPVPGGSFDVLTPDDSGVGEILYSGPNVMMGYAETQADLLLPQQLPQTLVTGDLGYLSDGALFLVGRTKRIVKIFGVRVSLDDVDRWLSSHGHGIAVQGNDIVVVFIEAPFEDVKTLRAELSDYLKVNKAGIRVEVIPEIPLLSSGKIDFQKLTAMASV